MVDGGRQEQSVQFSSVIVDRFKKLKTQDGNIFQTDITGPDAGPDEDYYFEYEGEDDGTTPEERCKSTGANIFKLFWLLKVSNTYAYPVLHSRVDPWPYLHTLGWKGLPEINTLAYYKNTYFYITTVSKKCSNSYSQTLDLNNILTNNMQQQ
jgi:hypothetical protein